MPSTLSLNGNYNCDMHTHTHNIYSYQLYNHLPPPKRMLLSTREPFSPITSNDTVSSIP